MSKKTLTLMASLLLLTSCQIPIPNGGRQTQALQPRYRLCVKNPTCLPAAPSQLPRNTQVKS